MTADLAQRGRLCFLLQQAMQDVIRSCAHLLQDLIENVNKVTGLGTLNALTLGFGSTLAGALPVFWQLYFRSRGGACQWLWLTNAWLNLNQVY